MGEAVHSSPAPGSTRLGLVHVATRISDFDGISISAIQICESLHKSGVDVTIASVSDATLPRLPDFARSFPPGPFVKALGNSRALRQWLFAQASRGDRSTIIHSHGLWRMPNVYAGWVAAKTSSPLVVSPHGALARRALAKGRYMKKVFSALLQARALGQATCFHATSEAECEDIRRAGFRQPVCILRHGVGIPRLDPVDRSRRRLLFLGRVDALKGVDILLRAWTRVEAGFPSWDLEIVGPGDPDEVGALQALARRLGTSRVRFRGALQGPDKVKAFQEASLFVLPSPSENFGLVIAESLASGTPVIVTKGTPWSQVESRQAGWWIDVGVDSLEATLKLALSKSPAELQHMGGAGRAWMASDFSWEEVGRQWLETYGWLARPDAEPRPPWVRVD